MIDTTFHKVGTDHRRARVKFTDEHGSVLYLARSDWVDLDRPTTIAADLFGDWDEVPTSNERQTP